MSQNGAKWMSIHDKVLRNWNKRKCLNKKRVQLLQDWFDRRFIALVH